MAYNILLMGASYGSLLASKLLFGGHSIHLVCLPAEADLINAEGFRVTLPVRGRAEPVLIPAARLGEIGPKVGRGHAGHLRAPPHMPAPTGGAGAAGEGWDDGARTEP